MKFVVLQTDRQDLGKEGLRLRGVAVMTETAITAKTAETVKAAGCLIVLCYKCRTSKGRVRCSPKPPKPSKPPKDHEGDFP